MARAGLANRTRRGRGGCRIDTAVQANIYANAARAGHAKPGRNEPEKSKVAAPGWGRRDGFTDAERISRAPMSPHPVKKRLAVA
jgi:hypothetical protein